jgi:hypothetical protein
MLVQASTKSVSSSWSSLSSPNSKSNWVDSSESNNDNTESDSELHQENRKALVGLAARPNQSLTRANQTRPDQKDDQSTRTPLCLKPEVAHYVFSIINLHLNHHFFSNQNNQTKPEH